MGIKEKTKRGISNLAVELVGVSFAYNGVPVLSEVYLEIPPGAFFVILGANGSAKTTLIKIMLGLLKPRQGAVKLLGEDLVRFKDWGKIGYVSQLAGHINPSFPATVEEVVASGHYSGFGRYETSKRALAVQRALERVGIVDISSRRIGELSGGQRQKAFLAKALVKDPDIIFLDEPTTGVDSPSVRDFYTLLDVLHRQGTTIIMVTHDLSHLGEGKSLCLVKDGKVYPYTGHGKSSGGDINAQSLGL